MTETAMLAAIDRDAFAAIAERFRDDKFAKYLDLPLWLHKNVQRAQRLGLDRSVPRRVLDLGCGCGYFLHVCRMLGHEVCGVDWYEPGSLFDEMRKLLDVPVAQYRIEAGLPIPGAGAAEVVTAHMITFNGHCEQPWGRDEWAWFLDQFQPGAMIGLEMNREPDGIMYQRGVAELFGERGGVISERHVVFSKLRARAPSAPFAR